MKLNKVILFGSGKEIEFILKNSKGIFEVIAFGVDESNKSGASESLLYCKTHNIPILHHYSQVVDFEFDIVFMMSYPKLIPNEYLKKYRFINAHGALIPKYRGIHGGTWAIVNGEKYHGYSVHLVTEGIDNGPVYHQGVVEMLEEDNINTIREKIYELFTKEIIYVLSDILLGKLEAIPQDEKNAIYVCRRKPEDGLINWNANCVDIYNLVRALTPPYTTGAYTLFKGKVLVIPHAKYINSPIFKSINGQVVNFEGDVAFIKCHDGYILVKEVMYDGEKINAKQLFKAVGHRLG